MLTVQLSFGYLIANHYTCDCKLWIFVYIQDITKISILIGAIWNKEQATLLPSLTEIFTIISSDKIPSNALGKESAVYFSCFQM